jgi:hypothetical protein
MVLQIMRLPRLPPSGPPCRCTGWSSPNLRESFSEKLQHFWGNDSQCLEECATVRRLPDVSIEF